MLSVPTLWTVFVVNFLALGLIWVYVARCYPTLIAARFWAASAWLSAVGACCAMMRLVWSSSLLPLLAAGTLLVFATWLAEMGVRCFYGKPVSWRIPLLTTSLTTVALSLFIFAYDSVSLRVAIYTVAQIAPMVLAVKLLARPENGRTPPGAQLATIVATMIMGMYVLRLVGAIVQPDEFSFMELNTNQSVAVLILMFLSMTLNFGFLLMAMDRLRNEVADLALLDDLTGVGNRRHLVQRLQEECARSDRSGDPFALLVIDLDGFKAINDTHGHAAGDACLQHFALMAQTRLRPGDMLARTGGDEFCIVLPSSMLREGAMIARRVLEVVRADAEQCAGQDIPIAVSIGVAQWTRDIGQNPERLIGYADQALYDAKKSGKNGYASYQPTAPALAPDMVELIEAELRKRA